MKRIITLFTAFFFVVLSSQYALYGSSLLPAAGSDAMRFMQSNQFDLNRLLLESLTLGLQCENSEATGNTQKAKFDNTKQGLHRKELSHVSAGSLFEIAAAEGFRIQNPTYAAFSFRPVYTDCNPRAP